MLHSASLTVLKPSYCDLFYCMFNQRFRICAGKPGFFVPEPT